LHIILSALCLLGAVQGNATRHPLGLLLVAMQMLKVGIVIPVVEELVST